MKRICVLIISLLFLPGAYSFTIITWNIQDLGRTKTSEEIDAMVQILRNADVVLIQEVVAKDPAGAQKVAALADGLNRTGARWDYRISDPTNSPSPYISERYAILWKPSVLEIQGRARLLSELSDECDREPFAAEFSLRGESESLWIVNFHARRHDNFPDEEIKHFITLGQILDSQHVIIGGDFNLDDSHEVWTPFYQIGYRSVVSDLPTTLKRSCNRRGEYFNYPIDNIYLPEGWVVQDSGRIDTAGDCDRVEEARGLSDHLPVFAEISPE